VLRSCSDDPFRDLDPSVKPLLLELLGRSAGDPQIVFLTEDEHVASWARLEALTGEVALIEPAPEHDEVQLPRDEAIPALARLRSRQMHGWTCGWRRWTTPSPSVRSTTSR
jgi:hypothetical protein